MVARIALLLSLTFLAGCADDAVPEPTPDEVEAKQQELVHMLSFAEAGESVTESFSGRFEFADNQQFVGSLERDLGMNQNHRQSHAIGHLLPADGLYVVHAATTAQPGGGDIDTGFDGEVLINTFCDCPFGGANDLFGYGQGSGELDLLIQYDEISSGPTDPSIALQGFDYTIEVTVRPLVETVPAGVPVAVELQVGAVLIASEFSEPVTVYDPADQRVKVFEPGDESFTVTTAGEHVVIGQVNGGPFALRVENATEAPARLLSIVEDGGGRSVPAGTSETITFEAPATVIEVGGCGLAGRLSAQPAMRIVDPAGETWAAAANGAVVPLGWGSCAANWLGDPDQQPGEWRVEMVQAAGDEIELFWWTSAYQR